MISYADLEFAIARWKARASGVPQPAAPVPSGAVSAAMTVSNNPEDGFGEPAPSETPED